MNDSLSVIKILDSLRIVQVSSDGWWDKFMDILTIFGGGIFGLIGYWLGHHFSGKQQKDQQARQDRAETNREMLKHRLEVYRDAAELLSRVYSTKIEGREGTGSFRQFPYAYETWDGAKKWMNDLVAFFDEHRFLLDKDSYRAFQALNRMVLNQHLKAAEEKGFDGRDEELKRLGTRDVHTVHDHVNAIYQEMQGFLNKKYVLDLDIPEVR